MPNKIVPYYINRQLYWLMTVGSRQGIYTDNSGKPDRLIIDVDWDG